MELVILIFLSLIVVVICQIVETKKNNRLLQPLIDLKSYEQDFNNAMGEFEVMGKSGWYISNRQYQQWRDKYAYLAKKINLDWINVKTEDPFKGLIFVFVDLFNNGRKVFIDEFNECFLVKEAPVIRKILNEKKIQNNSDQVNAIASDEDNTLLVAGAGTGKTTTILGKLAYLFERIKVKPEDILLLSFTGRAVEELSSRIAQKFKGVDIKAQTFHSFGLSLISIVTGKKPSLAFSTPKEKRSFLNNKFSELLKNNTYLHSAIEYFAYYFKPVVLEPGFNNLDEYYKYSKAEEIITLKKELVKSQQELMIANFLYLNGVNYVYEKPYQFETADRDYRQYKPDFFLSDYGIYLEHFGIDKNGQTKFTSDHDQNIIHSKKYQEQMDWKRQLHAKYKTQLIETYSYEFTDKTWQQNLTEKLKKHGVKFSARTANEIYATLADDVTVKKIIELFEAFLDLSKSNGYSLQDIANKVLARNIFREQIFLNLFSPIYKSYESRLRELGAIDFHDMLIQAADFVNNGQAVIKLKYIIIDEFQDFSISKNNLVKALCVQNPDVKLFCVGDDWQSIFRFTGSDISLMTEFEKAYGFTRKDQLVVTNRFNDKLALVSNRFILKNPDQIRKEVCSGKHIDSAAIEVVSGRKHDDIDRSVEELLNSINKESAAGKKISSVFVLGRYKHNEPMNLGRYKREYKNLSIEFLTIHSSKGLEADYVIVMDVISGTYGFPTGVMDDPILNIVLSDDESYPHAEERRLMYVAITRAKNKVYIMTEDGKKSVFALELENIKNNDNQAVRCSECGGEMVLRKGKYGEFYGCINFPECRNKEKLV